MSEPDGEIVREATRGGVRVALLRCYPEHGRALVEAEIVPAGETAPVQQGPHLFATMPEARRFVDETMLALQYLGCRVDRA